jgi:hypothetical protein
LPKKRYKRYTSRSFVIGKVFPATDPIAIDLLRLMAGYNDLHFIMEWFEAHRTEAVNENVRRIATGRVSLQLRLMYSFLHESLVVINKMARRPEFKELLTHLNDEGKTALESLLTVKLNGVKEGENTFNERLLHARHTATFHYDEQKFMRVLEDWIKVRRSNEKSYFIDVSDDRLTGSLNYYLIADQIRADLSFGLRNPKQREEMQTMLAFTRSLSAFLSTVFQTYVTNRKLQNEFSEAMT